MVEDLERALLVRQRMIFMDGAGEDGQKINDGTIKKEEEASTELANIVANYYICPFYMIPDPECFFEYSHVNLTPPTNRFTTCGGQMNRPITTKARSE